MGRGVAAPLRIGPAHGRGYTAAVPASDPEEVWRALLTGEHRGVQSLRRTFRSLPAPPRCKMCYAPFKGVGGFLLKPWFGPWQKNAQLCKNCMAGLVKLGPGGAEIELSMLFADIRGSTGLAERLGPAEFTRLLSAFYRLAAAAIIDANGIVDKFVGDEAIGLFIPGIAGPRHAALAIAAARALLEAVARPGASSTGPIPVGIGVHSGTAYVGSIGSSEDISGFTALGDPVNATARLASLARAGELLVSVDTAAAAELDATGLERRTVEVRGREATMDVYSITTGAPGAA